MLSMSCLLRGAPKFVNGYMDEVLVKGVANFINGLFGEGKIVKTMVKKSK